MESKGWLENFFGEKIKDEKSHLGAGRRKQRGPSQVQYQLYANQDRPRATSLCLSSIQGRCVGASVRLRAWGHCTREKQEDPRPATRASDTHLRQMSWGMLSSCLDHRQSSGKKVGRGNFLQFPHLPVVAHSGFLVACCCPCLIYSAGILCLAKTDVSLLCVCL